MTKVSFPVALPTIAACLLGFSTLTICLVQGAQGNKTTEAKPPAQALEFFERSVRPVLARNCYACHGSSQEMGGLRLDTEAAILRGGTRGTAVVPGHADQSLLIKAVRHDGLQMPLGGKLTDSEIEALVKWVNLGAPWPKEEAKNTLGPKDPGFYEKIRREHWAYQPLIKPKVPVAKNSLWSNQPVDHFILGALEKKGLGPSAPADKRTLARRLSFVLTGLPPTPLEVDLFVRDQTPGAYDHLVQRLLSSPHFGEHWARHWMDVVRFGETFGNDWNYELHGAWLYRDYLIRAFNSDVPYDELIREHLAGDLLEKPRLNKGLGINESVIGTAFYRLGEQGHDNCIFFRAVRTDVVDNQIDVLGKAFLGLTAACARCHDHKLDPIPTADYYALYGVLTSSRMVMRTADLPEMNSRFKQQLLEMKPQIRAELVANWTRETDSIVRDFLAADRAWKGLPPEETDKDQPLEKMQSWLTLLSRRKIEMEDPLYPWVEASRSQDLGNTWQQLSARYIAEAKARATYNQDHFQTFGDFRSGSLSAWHAEGLGLQEGGSAAGEFAVAPAGSRAVTGIYPAGLYSHLLSERLNGALRSPSVPKDKKFVSIQVLGGRLGSRRTILDNCMLSEDYEFLNRDSLTWVKLPSQQEQKAMPLYVELVTKTDNPRLPDRPDRMKVVKSEDIAAPFSYFGIARAVVHDEDATPKDELTHLQPLFSEPAPSNLQALAKRYATALRQALAAWGAGKATDDDARWIHWFVQNGLLTNSKEESPRLRSLIDEYRAIDSRIAAPRVFHGMADLDHGYDVPIFLAGNPEQAGKVVHRGFLELVKEAGSDIEPQGSGRREVAELIASPRNPLTARVMVNRLWHHLFGAGIVSTTDNFGRYGDAPSNPELLDYLAARFIEEGWSVKKLIRALVLSKTFQQSSQQTARALEADPQNRLLHHYPVRRLEAESIRDEILVTSGRLDPTLYGPSIQPYRTEPKEYRRLFKGPLDGDGRRSIYLKVTRHEGPRFLEIFDFPEPMVPRGTRDNTNVPPQALALMNDPFVLDQASYWADQLIRDDSPSVEVRVDEMFRSALGRLPEPAERERFSGLATEMASQYKVEKEKLLTDKRVWKDVAHSFFLLKEFVYIR